MESGLPENTPPTNAFRTPAHTPRIGGSFLRLVFALLTETDLNTRLREMVILRVAERCDGRYVWIQHKDIARIVGVSEEQIAALERGETPDRLFLDRDRAAFAFADEVLGTARTNDDTFAAARQLFSPGEILELLLLIGYFRMTSNVMTTLEVELESSFGAKILEMVSDSVCPPEPRIDICLGS